MRPLIVIALVALLGGLVATEVVEAAPPFCGDNVRAGPEDCDGSDAAACPGQCQVDCTCPEPLSVLEERVAALEAQLAAALNDIAALQTDVGTAQTDISALQADVAAIEPIECLSDSLDGTEVFFEGCNVNIRDGSGDTFGPTNGLGNFIVGYNEDGGVPAIRTGSHNLIIGPEHTYSSFGGLVSGSENFIRGRLSTVSGGQNNTASGFASSVSGGVFNEASGDVSSVSGGISRSVSGTGNWRAGSLFEPQ